MDVDHDSKVTIAVFQWAARATKHVEVKEEEVESAAKNWLRFAKYCRGGRKERDLKKQSRT